MCVCLQKWYSHTGNIQWSLKWTKKTTTDPCWKTCVFLVFPHWSSWLAPTRQDRVGNLSSRTMPIFITQAFTPRARLSRTGSMWPSPGKRKLTLRCGNCNITVRFPLKWLAPTVRLWLTPSVKCGDSVTHQSLPETQPAPSSPLTCHYRKGRILILISSDTQDSLNQTKLRQSETSSFRVDKLG